MKSNNIFPVLFLAACFVLSGSCKERYANKHKMAGVYEVIKLEKTFYKNGEADSVVTIQDYGTICLFDQTANINDVDDTMPKDPDCWLVNSVGADEPVGWYTNDEGRIKTISFWSEDDWGSVHFATLNIDRFSNSGKMEWYYVHRQSDGNINYIETLHVKKQ